MSLVYEIIQENLILEIIELEYLDINRYALKHILIISYLNDKLKRILTSNHHLCHNHPLHHDHPYYFDHDHHYTSGEYHDYRTGGAGSGTLLRLIGTERQPAASLQGWKPAKNQ